MKVNIQGKTIKQLIGVAAAIAGTVYGVIALGSVFGASWGNTDYMIHALFLSILSYVLAGGFQHAIHTATAIMKWCFVLIPVFPGNIFGGLFGLFVSILLFLQLPIVFVLLAVKDQLKM